MNRPLAIFLCHASQDKPAVRELYKRLTAENWIDPWLDEENLLPGQDFDFEINRALPRAFQRHASDLIRANDGA